MIRYWLSLLNVRLPSQAIMQQIKQQLVYGSPDSHPLVRWSDIELIRVKDEISVSK